MNNIIIIFWIVFNGCLQFVILKIGGIYFGSVRLWLGFFERERAKEWLCASKNIRSASHQKQEQRRQRWQRRWKKEEYIQTHTSTKSELCTNADEFSEFLFNRNSHTISFYVNSEFWWWLLLLLTMVCLARSSTNCFTLQQWTRLTVQQKICSEQFMLFSLGSLEWFLCIRD